MPGTGFTNRFSWEDFRRENHACLGNISVISEKITVNQMPRVKNF